jgi:hypothetical protein
VGGVVVISAELIVASTGLLTTGGLAVKWLVGRFDRSMVEVKGDLHRIEKRYATLRVAFQMVANELARLEPLNPVLHRAQNALLREYGEPIYDDKMDDLLAKIP